MTTRLLLVRHGAVSYSGRVGGTDDRLNTLGELQTQALARRLAERAIAAIYTSPLACAAQTAALLAGFLGTPVHEDQRLQEWDPGEWRGLHEREAQAQFPGELRRAGPDPDFVIPGGESRETFRERVTAAADEMVFSHPGREVVAVSHSGALSTLIGYYLGLDVQTANGWPFTLDHCAITVVEYDGETAGIRTLNDAAHLEGLAL
ncbi:MAG TPA: histidine phosphatase family protein [Dehalococcoidia bacterium]|nr:histidine phosphatase family protein [Dehalococcoidia bacterium]